MVNFYPGIHIKIYCNVQFIVVFIGFVGIYLMTIEIWWLVEVLEDPVLFIWSMFSNM